MGYRGLSKFTATQIAIGTTATSVGYISGCFGAQHVVLRARNGPNANLLTFSFAGSMDGVNDAVSGTSPFLAMMGPAATNTAGGYTEVVVTQYTPAFGIHVYPCPYNFIHLFAAIATAGGNVTIEAWPVYLQTASDNPLGLAVT